MKITINIPDSVIERLDDLGVDELEQETLIINYLNDVLELEPFEDGFFDNFFKWYTTKKTKNEKYKS